MAVVLLKPTSEESGVMEEDSCVLVPLIFCDSANSRFFYSPGQTVASHCGLSCIALISSVVVGSECSRRTPRKSKAKVG